MPNYCQNVVTIRHKDAARITALLEAYTEQRWFSSIIPIPEPLCAEGICSYGGPDDEKYEAMRKKNEEELGFPTWYEFCTDKWDTMWEAMPADEDPEQCQISPNELHFVFDTAWFPPIGVYAAMRTEGFEVDGSYSEPGHFVGTWSNEGMEMWSLSDPELPEDLRTLYQIGTDTEVDNDG